MSAASPPLVLHVIHHLLMGGMENGLVNLINHMPAGRYRHAIACVEDYSDFRLRIASPDVEVIALHRSRIGSRGLRRALYTLCKRLQPAIVHSRNQSGLDALLPARLAGVPRRVHGEHGWDVDNLDGRQWKSALLRRVHSPLVDRYITVSRDLQDFLVRRIGIRQSRITQIYNGVDTGRFSTVRSTDALPGSMPEAFRGPELIRIGTVGRLQPVKDQASLLRAFAQATASDDALRQRARLLLIGGGPLMGDLQALATELRIADRTWFSGPLDDVPAALSALDLFVLPSLNEGISNTLLEAMASGVPVLATRVGGNVELVEDDRTGRLVAAGDVAALAEQMAAYATDEALRRRHGEAARRRAVEHFSLRSMVNGYMATYDELLAPR